MAHLPFVLITSYFSFLLLMVSNLTSVAESSHPTIIISRKAPTDENDDSLLRLRKLQEERQSGKSSIELSSIGQKPLRINNQQEHNRRNSHEHYGAVAPPHIPVNLQIYYHKLQQQQQQQQQQSQPLSSSTRDKDLLAFKPFLRGQQRVKQIAHPTLPYNCTSLPKTRHNRWLRTERLPTGLGNQLFGVYSYLAAAFYYNSSLIVDNLYSRTSFDVRWPLSQLQWTSLPFSSFFDWHHFSNFWKVRGVEMIEGYQYDHCPEPPERLKLIKLIRATLLAL